MVCSCQSFRCCFYDREFSSWGNTQNPIVVFVVVKIHEAVFSNKLTQIKRIKINLEIRKTRHLQGFEVDICSQLEK